MSAAGFDRQGSLIRQLQGRLTAGGATLAAGPSGSITRTTTPTAALTSGPSITIPVTGTYLVRYGAFVQSNAVGLFQGNVSVAKNGTGVGGSIAFVGQAQFDGGSIMGEQTLALAAGDVLTLVVTNNNTVSTTYANGTISATL